MEREKIFEQMAKLRKVYGAGLRRVPPMETGESAASAGEPEPLLAQPRRQPRNGIVAVPPTDK